MYGLHILYNFDRDFADPDRDFRVALTCCFVHDALPEFTDASPVFENCPSKASRPDSASTRTTSPTHAYVDTGASATGSSSPRLLRTGRPIVRATSHKTSTGTWSRRRSILTMMCASMHGYLWLDIRLLCFMHTCMSFEHVHWVTIGAYVDDGGVSCIEHTSRVRRVLMGYLS